MAPARYKKISVDRELRYICNISSVSDRF